MKILYLADARDIHTHRLIKYFADKGHEVHVASFERSDNLEMLENVYVHLLKKNKTLKYRLLSNFIGYLVPGVRSRINYWYVAFGAILPDIIDKTVGRVIFAHSLANGHLIAHTLVFGCFLALAGFYLYKHNMDARVLTVSGASLLHLVEDRLWTKPATLL